MELPDRIEAFVGLGEYLKEGLRGLKDMPLSREIDGEIFFSDPDLLSLSSEAEAANPWFIPPFVHHALRETSRLLERENLGEWTRRYPGDGLHPARPRVIGTILAGNIPLAGFHDFLSILISGNIFKGKMSGKDDRLLPFLADKLIALEPGFASFVKFEESRLGSIDAMIATGSNNSFRYFDYYFGSYPHIFRKNRNGAALIDGTETTEELDALADDIFLYFGLGCRSIAKIYVPQGYDFDGLFRRMEKYRQLIEHHKYANNYLYHRSIYLMNRVEHLDNGFLLVRNDQAFSSPVGTLHYESRPGSVALPPGLEGRMDSVQCIAGHETQGLTTLQFGRTQHPELWDYADHVDTMDFLINLS